MLTNRAITELEATEEKVQKAYEYAVGYMKYIDESKTEREAVKASIAYAKSMGFTEYFLGDKISVGDKKYFNNSYL